MNDRDAWFALGLVHGLAPSRAFELAERLGGPEAALTAPVSALRSAGIPDEVAGRLREAAALAAAEHERVVGCGAHVVTWADASYPPRLRPIADPPLALMVRGTLGADDAPAVAVVGARRADDYGRRVAGELATALAQAGITVVSGLAAGVDGAAHRGALAAGGRTLAVMATGIDQIYPSWHRALAAEIAAQGALMTEFATGTPPLKHHFPRRNRIVSALALGVIVVEAAERSGSLITARCALDQGRAVFAVPGPIGDGRHRGSHRLIQQGAILVTRVEDVLDELAPALLSRLAAARAAVAVAALAPEERRVLEAIGHDATHVDTIVARTGGQGGEALSTLLALELRGLVEQRPGGWFVSRRAA